MDNGHSILVIEDNPTTARTLRVFLEAERYVVYLAETGTAGISHLDRTPVDLVLLDVMLPDMDGISVCRKIRAHNNVPIVMLTARTTENEIVEGLEAGADDYVCKPFGSKELLARMRRCFRSSQARSAQHDALTVGDILMDMRKRTVAIRGKYVKLTKSEFEILSLLIRNPGRVYTRDQIIDRALDPGFDGYDRTVDTHIWSLRKKLGEPRGAPRYIQSELGIGYRMSEN